jgi:elongation factor Ts
MQGAKDWLRTKGLAGASKRAGRDAEEGAVDVIVDGNVAALVELTCETDFVAKGADFTSTLAALAKHVASNPTDELANQAFDGMTVGEAVTQLGAKLQEKIELGSVERYETSDGVVDAYKHIQNERGTIGVLVELGGFADAAKAQEIAHDIVLHIASAAPTYVRREDVPADVVEKERAVLEELTRNEGKPEAALPKIVEGRLGGFYRDNCLLEQAFVKDSKTTIEALVRQAGPEATVRRFARVKVGEG